MWEQQRRSSEGSCAACLTGASRFSIQSKLNQQIFKIDTKSTSYEKWEVSDDMPPPKVNGLPKKAMMMLLWKWDDDPKNKKVSAVDRINGFLTAQSLPAFST